MTAGQEAPAAGGAPGSRFPGNGHVSTQPQLLRPPRNQGSGHVSVPSPLAVGGVAGPVTQSGLRAGSASEGPAAGSPPTAGGRRGARCPRASAQPAARAVNPSLCARGGTHTPTLACGYAHTHTRTRVLMRKCPATLRPVDQRRVRTGPGGPLTPARTLPHAPAPVKAPRPPSPDTRAPRSASRTRRLV